MMASILKHMVEITAHRDHLLLDTSVVRALHDLVGGSDVRALEIYKLRGDLYVRPLVWITDGVVASHDDSHPEQVGDPLSSFPVLVECIESRKPNMQDRDPSGRHLLWLPVWTNDKVSTCIEICNIKPYDAGALSVIEGILSVYSNYQSLLDYSERDSLTGLLNRKTFDEKFSKMVSSSTQGESSPNDQQERRHQHADVKEQWLAVVDIDHFKRVNDQFGHLYGDEVLILVANILRASFRTQDRVFRFGGEEFVILLRSTSLEETHKIFERFRQNVEKYDFPQVGQVTISLGFASISQETPVVILGHADQALYYAKANGRNRVCHYDELVSSGLLHVEAPQESIEFFFDDITPT